MELTETNGESVTSDGQGMGEQGMSLHWTTQIIHVATSVRNISEDQRAPIRKEITMAAQSGKCRPGFIDAERKKAHILIP